MSNIFSKFAAAKKLVDVLPEVDFSVSTTGITIHSGRFSEPRYLEFEQKGKCRLCKSGTVDIEYYIDTNGVGIFSSRFDGPRYVAFDYPVDLPGQCVFRVRSKGQSYMIPYTSSKKEETKPPKEEIIEDTAAAVQ
jgi:hypothetical protein